MPRKNIDFSNTFFYRIVCKNVSITDCYVGHTTNITKRKAEHKFHCVNSNSKKQHFNVYQFIRNNGGWENWDIVEIERKSCIDLNDATKHERYWLEEYGATLNQIIPTRTAEERNKVNEEKRKEQKNQYRNNNKQSISDYDKEYRIKNNNKLKEVFTCECGGRYQYKAKAGHLKTNLHKNYLNCNG